MPSKYKHTGDDGKTAVPGESRVAKFHPRFEVLGDLDEASAAIGLARSLAKNDRHTGILIEAQKQLYLAMADIARPLEEKGSTPHLASTHLDWINTVTGELEAQIQLPSQFILPGDSVESAALSLARTIVRRAEREAAAYIYKNNVKNDYLLAWLNRLSHLLFLLEVSTASTSGEGPTLVK